MLEAQARPTPKPQEITVRTEYTLISPGTELALFEGTHAGLLDPEILFAKYPHQPGYTAIGRVEACGTGVTAVQPGERIFFLGRHELWSCLTPAESLWLKMPEALPVEQVLLGRMIQISATSWYCLRKNPERVVVIGAGLIGMLAAQVMQAQGVAEVVVQDVNAARLRLAMSCGVQRCALSSNDDLSAARSSLSGEPDAIIEATGVPSLVNAALKSVRKGGDVVLLGSPRGELTIDLYKLIHRKGVSLVGAHEAMLPDRAATGQASREALLRQAFAWLQEGAIRTNGLITHVVQPQELPSTYEHIARDKSSVLGVVVDWTKFA